MKHMELRLTAVTSTFQHGAMGGERAQLRPTAFEAAARFWYRAAVGIADPRKLSEAEGRLFGSADHGRGLVFDVRPRWHENDGRKFLLPHHPKHGKKRDSPSPSAAIVAGTELELRVHSARRSDGRALIDHAAAALWLALHLGGVGQRSRRGAGSFRVVSSRGDVEFEPARGETLAELASSLGLGVRRAKEVLQSTQSTGTASNVRYPVLAERVQVVGLDARDEESARKEIMLGLRQFKDPAFGLPYLKPPDGSPQVPGRHASPLWIRAAQLDGGDWVAIQTLLAGPTPKNGNRRRIEDYLDSFNHFELVRWQ